MEGATVKDGSPEVHIGTPDRLQGAGRVHSEAPSTRRPEVPAAQMPSGTEPKGQGVTTITMEALEGLFDRKLGPIHNDIAALKWQGVSKDDLSNARGPLTQNVEVLKGNVRKIEEGLEAAKATVEEAKISVEALRIEFEQRLNVARTSPPATPLLSAKESTVLFGGFGCDDFDDACSFINRELDKINIQRPLTQYFKGDPIKDPFKGQVFCKFANGQIADDAIRAFSSRTRQHNNKMISCKRDLPVDKLVCLSFLLGLRRQLSKWGLETVKADESTPLMTVSGLPVAEATIENDKINVKWLDATWAEWSELQDAPEYSQLSADNHKRLTKAAEASKKGNGKGRDGTPQ